MRARVLWEVYSVSDRVGAGQRGYGTNHTERKPGGQPAVDQGLVRSYETCFALCDGRVNSISRLKCPGVVPGRFWIEPKKGGADRLAKLTFWHGLGFFTNIELKGDNHESHYRPRLGNPPSKGGGKKGNT
ncbi:hypothetical protein MPNT_310009 [Candidatus Methylacidithermus pantelleriae]|uniref:Uncharacterized protein n=1 Tax=Candidatus Methylacidithermus pantelleriae TaxID=2744239 RepID=A0A8J2FWK8_9BACT|nr:hypothetical protein MPNT_310009 [Candidatus Methylacidithermus pantelleriae]